MSDSQTATPETPNSAADSTSPSKKPGGLLSWIGFLLGILVIAAVVMAIAGYLLPRDYEAESSVVINAPLQPVFERIDNLKSWQTWCPWTEESLPGIQNTYEGPDAGAGATWSWTHESGDGKQWITISDRNREIEFVTEFGGFPPMTTVVQFAKTDQGTEVRWRSRGRVGSGPIDGWICLMLPSMMSAEFDKGLAKLKQVVEEAGPYPDDPELNAVGPASSGPVGSAPPGGGAPGNVPGPGPGGPPADSADPTHGAGEGEDGDGEDGDGEDSQATDDGATRDAVTDDSEAAGDAESSGEAAKTDEG